MGRLIDVKERFTPTERQMMPIQDNWKPPSHYRTRYLRILSVVSLAFGLWSLSKACNPVDHTYSAANIWKRKAPLIEVKPKEQREELRRDLSEGIAKIRDAPSIDRCKFEKRFHARLIAGSEEEGEKFLKLHNYSPFEVCENHSQAAEDMKNPYSIGGMIFSLIGIVGIYFGFRRREEDR